MPETRWRGVFPAVTTPFTEDFNLDVEAFQMQIQRQLNAGVHGIVVAGSLGEASTLERDEKLELTKHALEVAQGKAPVLVCVAESSTVAGCRFAEKAATLGANGLMVLPPLNYLPDPAEKLDHFRQIASASDLGVMIYNNPVSYGTDVTPQQFAELASEPRFVAIKESSDDVRRITDLYNLLGDRYQLFSGVDDLALESLVMGAQGWVAGLVCAYPEETMAVYNLAQNGLLEDAREVYRWFAPLLHLDVSTKLVQNIKTAMSFEGCGTETVRLPRHPLTGEERIHVLQTLAAAKSSYSRISEIMQRQEAKEVIGASQLC